MRLRLMIVAVLGTALAGMGTYATVASMAAGVRTAALSGRVGDLKLMARRLDVLGPLGLAFSMLGGAALVFAGAAWIVADRDQRIRAELALLGSETVPPMRAGAQLGALEEQLRGIAARRRADQEAVRLARGDAARLAEGLAATQSRLVDADRLATVGRLAAGVAHEVGNPLSGILGLLSLLRERVQGDAVVIDLLARADAEVGRIDGVVRSLLELGRPSRVGAGLIDVCPIIHSTVQLLSKGAEWSGVQVHFTLPQGLVARAEEGPLSQILVNLLVNAMQAMGGKGTIRVFAQARGAHVEISVQDEGPGISPLASARLFELFFTTKPAGQGTGLGLAVSRHLARQMGGDLLAGNIEPRGACFRILLPGARAGAVT